MSTTYSVIPGDSFGLISIKMYGVGSGADRIRQANPGVLEPLSAGIVLTIPDPTGTPKNAQQKAAAENPDEIALLIDGKRFRFFTDIQINRAMDAMDTIAFTAPFDPDNKNLRDLFVPGSYKTAEITVGGEPFFTGTLLFTPPESSGSDTITTEGYSLPGVFSDCSAPASAYPLEFNGQAIREITKTIADLFGIEVQVEGDQGPVFERVSLGIGKKIMSFLNSLSQDRGLLSRSTPEGALLYYTPKITGEPVARFQAGSTPVVSVTPNFDTQGFYSDITGFEPVALGLKGAQFTAKNTKLQGVLRPFTYLAKDTEGGDLKKAVDAKLGRMYASAVRYSVLVDTMRDQAGALWEPDTFVTLNAPNVMIYNDYLFQIESVGISKTEDSKTAILELILPGSLSGKVPEAMPWEQ